MGTKLYGASDDLIELDGDISEEFSHYMAGDDDNNRHLAFSDGTLLKVYYDKDSIWRFPVLIQGSLFDKKIECPFESEENGHSDQVLFKDGLKWVVCGEDFAKSK